MAETPKEFMELLKAKLKANPEEGKSINAIYQFILQGKEGGDWWVDLTKSPGEIVEGKNDTAGCTITIDVPDFSSIMKKTANPVALFMSKKLKVSGELTLALKLQNILNIL
jgi:putative sterol carrier protein